ncbi:unnamed protein product [Ectocarpus sp. 12 AP-2014]
MPAGLRAREQAMRLLLCASVFSAAVVRNSGGAALSQVKMHTASRGTRAASCSGGRATSMKSAVSSVRRHTRRRNSDGGMLDATAATSAEASSSSSPADQEQIVTVCGESEAEETIKKSRFIGRCGPAATFEEGKALLGRVLKEHPKARHSCWAWRGLGDDHRFSDDGEPGGTAGQPILGGIESEGVSEVMVVVTRYSGGIKLGTGGLCRAYGGASRQCLQAAEREARTPVLGLTITAPVGSVGSVYHAVSNCRRLSEEFTAEGSVVLRVTAEVGQVEEVRRRIQDATKGAAEVVEEAP